MAIPFSSTTDTSAFLTQDSHTHTHHAEQAVESQLEWKQIESSGFEIYFDILGTCEFLQRINAQVFAMQFPDYLLPFANRVVEELEKKSKARGYILGDTTFGSCCVDEIAAQHIGADAIIHYGHACLTPTRRIPVRYVFGDHQLDLDSISCMIEEFTFPSDHVIILYDLVFANQMTAFREKRYSIASEATRRFYVANISKESNNSGSDDNIQPINPFVEYSEQTGKFTVCGYGISLPADVSIMDICFLWIGDPDNPTFSALTLNLPSSTFFVLDTNKQRILESSKSTSRTLSRRYYLMNKAKNANIIGIVLGTLGAANYLTILRQLQKTIALSNKKSYVFVVGKINEPKLANYAEIDIFVLVACPLTAVYDSAGHYRDVVTPIEMIMALTGKPWIGTYSTDFRALLERSNESSTSAPVEIMEDDEDRLAGVRFDPVTGKIREALPSGNVSNPEESSTASTSMTSVTDTSLSVATAAQVRQTTLTWHGLETPEQRIVRSLREGDDETLENVVLPKVNGIPVSVLKEGLSGIARSYQLNTKER